MSYLSHARFAQAYALAISSSCFRLLHLLRDCASKELASSISSGGRVPEWRGMRLLRAWMTGLLIFLGLKTVFVPFLRVVVLCRVVFEAPAQDWGSEVDVQPRAIRVAGLGNFSASSPCNCDQPLSEPLDRDSPTSRDSKSTSTIHFSPNNTFPQPSLLSLFCGAKK